MEVGYELIRKGDLVCMHYGVVPNTMGPVDDIGVVTETCGTNIVKVHWQKNNRIWRHLREELVILVRGPL